MKLKLITFSTMTALSLGSFAFAQEPQSDNPNQRGRRGGGNRRGVLETMTDRLYLTPEQKTKVQPIIDQTSPQIQTIRRDAEQKIKALVDNAMTQIRPILTPEQQKILDESQQQHRGGRRNALGGNHGIGEGQAEQQEHVNQ
jgi:Spy/CpxP family protein refolding chaperone